MEFNSTEELIKDIKSGKMVILLDDEDRENEGDLVCAADSVTPEIINFMVSKGRGLVCLTLSPEKCDQLNLPMMTNYNRTKHGTAFTVSIEAANGISTGISASDRALTIKAAAAKDAKPSDLVQPGHIFPLRASEGGVLSRAGHTEAACDLAKFANKGAAGVICEIMNEDGTMARRDDLIAFAKTHKLKIGTIADLIHYRTLKEKTVEKLYSRTITIDGMSFKLKAWEDSIFQNLHLTFEVGNIKKSDAPLVRVHVPNVLHDMIGMDGFGKRMNIKEALKKIHESECGVLLMIGTEQKNQSIMMDLEGKKNVPQPETKTVGIGSQILKELGLTKIKLLATPVKYPSISGFDLEVIGFEK